ncbi:MAG: bifunctional tetrahydrofolate synthase/dihydrofolate synthase [Gammaproteobacteria bacterium]|jgi:dihydrofolate synthase/folylpolyglutamate synthase
MSHRALSEWLAWQEQLHPSVIDLGLERVAEVWKRLHPAPFKPFVMTVAGTNGKGSCVAYLDAILRHAGYRTGSYTSPHLVRYNERIRVDGEAVNDEAICAAFERIDTCRESVSLTYFEFGTLAALDIFAREAVDVAILEVGLGGRLDAVNLLDADAVLVTSIGLDHTEWLGDDLNAIAREKAGVLRKGQPAVFAESVVPAGFLEAANEKGACVTYPGKDYSYAYQPDAWSWQMDERELVLPFPRMSGDYQLQNAAAVVTLLQLVQDRLPVTPQAIGDGLREATAPARFQQVHSHPSVYVDVAHNAEAAIALAGNLAGLTERGRVHAIFSIYADKPVTEVVRALAPIVDVWHLYALTSSRALDIESLASAVKVADHGAKVMLYDTLDEAIRIVNDCDPLETVVIFGSFEVAGEALRVLGVEV